MFGWFWNFLYSITRTIFRLIDGLVLCANKLCGIEPVNFDGEETDFMTYLFFSSEVSFAFKISALLATILLVVFTVFMIIRSITKDKSEGTPAQIAVKSFKTILMFFFVPGVMLAFMTLGNAFVRALYNATMQSAATPGTFLFSLFARDGGMKEEAVMKFLTGVCDYRNRPEVSMYMDISEFPFIFSWLAGGIVLFGIASSMLIFVDRVISLVILYIAAPVSISSSVLDEGARFKLWRDQFLSKFVMGYGMILAINIYALVCGLMMKPDFCFFEDDAFLDMIMKLLIIGGGALTMQKSMALVGNLVSSGAGSNELRDNLSAGAIAKATKSLAGAALGVPSLPFRAGASILGDAIGMQSRHLGGRLLRGLGLDGGLPRDDKKKDGEKDGDSDSKNNEGAKYGSEGNTKSAINDDDKFKLSFDKDNTNNNKPDDKKDNPVTKAVENKPEGQDQGKQEQAPQGEGNK